MKSPLFSLRYLVVPLFFGAVIASAGSRWTDASFDASGGHVPCPATDPRQNPSVHCAFADQRSGYLWAGGGNDERSQAEALAACRDLGPGWEAPSRDDASSLSDDAPDDPTKGDGFLTLAERTPWFVELPIGASFWTSSPDPTSPGKAWAALRLGESLNFVVSSTAASKHWLCVEHRADSPVRTSTAPPLPASAEAPAQPPAAPTPEAGNPVAPTPESGNPVAPTPESGNPATSSTGGWGAAAAPWSESALGTDAAPAQLRAVLAKILALTLNNKAHQGNLVSDQGDVTLSRASGFAFAELATRIDDARVPALRALLRRYRDVLEAVDQATHALASIEILGYSSPSRKGAFADAKSDLADGQALNFNLSLKRAGTIWDLLSQVLSQAAFTRPVHVFLTARGSRHPVAIPATAKGAAKEGEKCKPYSCSLSRRVVIRFHLQGETEP